MPSAPQISSGYSFDVFNHINNPIFVVSKRGSWLFHNRAFEDLTGIKVGANKRHMAAVKILINSALGQQCINNDTAIFTGKILQCAIDPMSREKKDLNVQIHKYMLLDHLNRLKAYIGIIWPIDQEARGDPGLGLIGLSNGEFHQGVALLTKTELHVLNLIAHGFVTKKIAQLMGSSIYTISNHQKSIYKKLGAHSKIEAINLARKSSLWPRDLS